MRKKISSILLGSLLAVGATAVYAENIVINVPYPPGGAADRLARVIAQGLTEDKGYQVLVENRPGAGAQVAMNQLKKAKNKDDIVLILSDHSAFTLNEKLYKKLNYSVKQDIKPVTLLAEAPIFLLTKSNHDLDTAEKFLEAAKTKKLTYGAPGIGTGTHLTGAMLNQSLQANLTFVPYRGAAPALIDLVGNQLDFMFDVLAGSQAFLEDNQLSLLAIAAPERNKLKPDVPTLKELGVDDVNFTVWWALGAQSKLSDDIINKIQKDVADIMNTDKNIDLFEKSGMIIKTTSPAELTDIIDDEIKNVGPIIDKLGISIN